MNLAYFLDHPQFLAVQLIGGLLLLRSVYQAGPVGDGPEPSRWVRVLAGRRGQANTPTPWALLIAGQLVLLAYMALTGQVGFLLWNVGMIWIGAHHLYRVTRGRRVDVDRLRRALLGGHQ
jgi:hypothetical protein